MPQFNRNELDVAARRSGFARDTFEKVVRLKEILTWISEQDILKDHLLLKGGTAINLTIFDLPRLSVDIDMDFTPNFEKPDMMAMRKEISNIILAYMESEGYTMSTASRFHQSLDSFYFTYVNAAGNKDMIKLELNYSLRAHVINPTKRIITIDTFGNDIGIMTVDPLEIFAAKANALLSRAAARDLYDMNTMITQGLFENQKDLMRKCIIYYASISREKLDISFDTNAIDSLTFQKIRRDLFPVLGQEERHAFFDLEGRKQQVKDYIQSLMIMTDSEKEYIYRFSKHEYQPELLFEDTEIVERIKDHPMAIWKCSERENMRKKSHDRDVRS